MHMTETWSDLPKDGSGPWLLFVVMPAEPQFDMPETPKILGPFEEMDDLKRVWKTHRSATFHEVYTYDELASILNRYTS